MSNSPLSEELETLLDECLAVAILHGASDASIDDVWKVRRKVEALFASRPVDAEADDDLEWAWGIIANAHGGTWTDAHPDWQKAAANWRDRVMPKLSQRSASREASPVPETLCDAHKAAANDHAHVCIACFSQEDAERARHRVEDDLKAALGSPVPEPLPVVREPDAWTTQYDIDTIKRNPGYVATLYGSRDPEVSAGAWIGLYFAPPSSPDTTQPEVCEWRANDGDDRRDRSDACDDMAAHTSLLPKPSDDIDGPNGWGGRT